MPPKRRHSSPSPLASRKPHDNQPADPSTWYTNMRNKVNSISNLSSQISHQPHASVLFSHLNELISLDGRALFEYHAWDVLASPSLNTPFSLKAAEALKQTVTDQLATLWDRLSDVDQVYWALESAKLKDGLRECNIEALEHLRTGKEGVAEGHIQMAVKAFEEA